MAFTLRWLEAARSTFLELQAAAEQSLTAWQRAQRGKATKAEGLFKQVVKFHALQRAACLTEFRLPAKDLLQLIVGGHHESGKHICRSS